MSRRVVVTGVGALSALGTGVEALWSGLCEGRSGIRVLERLRAHQLAVTWGGEVDGIPSEPVVHDHLPGGRGCALAEAAIAEALTGARLSEDRARLGLVWSTGLDSFDLRTAEPEVIGAGRTFEALAQGFGAPRRMVAMACASGTQAVGAAFQAVRAGRVEACMAGGSSAMLTPLYVAGFVALGALAVEADDPARACRPFDVARSGFALANGAGALVVESLDSARRRGVAPLAEILGFGSSADAFDLNRPPADGAGAAMCLERALADARVAAPRVDTVNAHGTGTLAGDLAEAAAIARVIGPRALVHSVKGAIGHAMAAAGALEAIVAVRTVATGRVPPTVNLSDPDPRCAVAHVIGQPADCDARTVVSTSFGMGGQNAALVVARWPGSPGEERA